MAKVLYFTAGQVPTAGELADIAALNAAALAPYEIGVRSGDVARVTANYGEGRLEPCDYVAGTVPAAYNAIPVIDPDNIPATGLSDTQAVVEDGVAIAITGGTVAFDIVDGEITGGAFTATP